MAQSYFIYKNRAWGSFELLVRDMPKNRAYLVACGVNDALSYIKSLKFTEDDIAYLRKLGLFSEAFLKYLLGFKFTGEAWAMREGEIFFPGEPVIRVTAPIIEAQILESSLLNIFNLQAMIASKASRVVNAAGERQVFDFSLRRTHGFTAGLKVARSSYIAGFSGTSNVLASKLYEVPSAGTMAHAFVMSFKEELDSFLAYADTFPKRTILLVDTYDTKRGIDNAVSVGFYLKRKGFKLLGVRLDSGDIVSLSKYARQAFLKAGMSYVKIFASGNLDEFKIEGLIKKGAQVDSFGVGTNMGTSIDAPSLDVIYKISEVTDETGRFIPTMKLSKAKASYPGRKQVFRLKDKKGRFVKDILGLEKENIKGRPLLKKAINKGRLLSKERPLKTIRELHRRNIFYFNPKLMQINCSYKYPVEVSQQLRQLKSKLTRMLIDKP